MSQGQGFRRRVVRIETGEVFPSAFEASHSMAHAMSPRDIVACCRATATAPEGVTWQYAAPRPGEAGYPASDPPQTERAVMIFHSNGRSACYETVSEAARELGTDSQTVRRAIQNRWVTKFGFRAMWLADYAANTPIPSRPAAHAVLCVDTGETFRSVEEAERYARSLDPTIDADAILAVCQGTRSSTFGLRWRAGDSAPQKTGSVHRGPPRRPIIGVDATGLERRFDSIRAAALELAIKATSISHVLCGKRFSAGGYRWFDAAKLDRNAAGATGAVGTDNESSAENA
jgi:hypothetical protein